MPELHPFLAIDLAAEADRIVEAMRSSVRGTMKRKGAVIGLSGGIDSSVCAALAVRAFGRDKVMGLHMPEADSADETLELSQLMADSLGIETALDQSKETRRARIGRQGTQQRLGLRQPV